MHRKTHRLIAMAATFAAVLAIAKIAGSVAVDASARPGHDAARRFVVLVAFQNKAVLDRETRLVWQRSPSLEERKWVLASQGCRALDLGGQSGWRLPSLDELASLAGADDALANGHAFANVAEQGYYWSATIHENGAHVYAKKLGVSASVARLATDRSHALCVRGPDASAGD